MISASKTLLALALTLRCLPACGQSPERKTEQTHFSMEDDGVAVPQPIPDEVLKILAQDPDVETIMESEKAERPALSWMSASRLRLANDGSEALVVVGKGPLRGANVTGFWVFTHIGKTYTLALNVAAHDLVVLPRRINGYRLIEADSETAIRLTTVTFRFQSGSYRKYKTRAQEIR
jgi:hypothetical protein